jgi:hypothetical protein
MKQFIRHKLVRLSMNDARFVGTRRGRAGLDVVALAYESRHLTDHKEHAATHVDAYL